MLSFVFFFQAEDGIRDGRVTGVQTCALPICPCGPTGGPPHCRRVRQRELQGRSRGCRDRGPVRGPHRRDRRRAEAPPRKAGARHVPRGGEGGRRRTGRSGRLRGRAGGRRGRTRRALRLRRRSRPHRPARGPARARRRRCRLRPGRAAGAKVIIHPAFAVEPWNVRETHLDLNVLAQTESVFALSNGHIGLRANLDEGEPYGIPGTYLNSFYELRPHPYAEAGYGFPESGQTVLNVTNGKIIRLIADEPAPPTSNDPRTAAMLESPLTSEDFSDRGTRVVLVYSTKRSKLLMAAAMDHTFEGPDGTLS